MHAASSLVINGRFLSMPHGGVARVGRELFRALADELRARNTQLELRIAAPPGTSVGELGDSPIKPTRGLPGRLGEQLLPFLYPGATFLNFCNVTPILARRSIVWLHDAHVFDAPESYPPQYRAWHLSILSAARLRKFQVVTVSEFARRRLVHHGIDARLIRVIYNGGDHILREPEDRSVMQNVGIEGRPFVLVVGSPARHKNVPFAVDALLKRTESSLRIAVVGMSQSGPYRAGQRIPQHQRLAVLPRVDDSQLRALYASARAVISPSLAEGFGLYVAEAMFAESGPLVLSNRTALPEVGGDAALYFDPSDPHALAAAVTDAMRPEIAARLRANAQARRVQFHWRNSAQQIIDGLLGEVTDC